MFEFKLKIYYEDTDSGGVVYYANYLKFTERARTNLINDLGYSPVSYTHLTLPTNREV